MSKAIMLSHTNITSVLVQITSGMAHFDYGKDVVLGIAPLFHIMGAHVVAMQSWLRGAPVVLLPRFEPDTCLAAIEKYKITVSPYTTECSIPCNNVPQNLPVVPPLLAFLAKSPLVDKYDLSSVTNVGSGAAPVSSDMYDICNERFARRGVRLENGSGYGLTETSQFGYLPLLAFYPLI